HSLCTTISHYYACSFLMLCPTPSSTLFPYTTLFRSTHLPLGLQVLPAGRFHGGQAGYGRDVRTACRRGRRARPELRRRHTGQVRSEEHTSELQSLTNLVCRLLLEKKKQQHY